MSHSPFFISMIESKYPSDAKHYPCLDVPADIEPVCNDDELFYLAIKDNDTKAISKMVETRCVNIGTSLRQYSVNTGCGTLQSLLLQSDNDTRAHDTLVHLVRLGARIDLKNERGELPIHEACRYGNCKAVVFFISEYPDCKNIKDNRGRSPLHTTLTNCNWFENKHAGIVEVLIQNGVEVNSKFDGLSSLHLCCSSLCPKYETVKLLMDAGADVNATTSDGRTALHLALFVYQPSIIKLLLDYGADSNAVDKSGISPLWVAVTSGHQKGIRDLVESGADVNYCWAKSNKTILEKAVELDLFAICQFLIESGIKMSNDIKTIQKLLKYAMANDLSFVKKILVHYYPVHDEKLNKDLNIFALNTNNTRLFNILHLAGAKFDQITLSKLSSGNKDLTEWEMKLSQVPRLKHLTCLEIRKRLGFGIKEKLLTMKNANMIPPIFVDHIRLLSAMDKESDVY